MDPLSTPDFDDERPTIASNSEFESHPDEMETIGGEAPSGFDGPTLPKGSRIGKYVIEGVLGVGGMGAVYLAKQRKPNRRVALKLIRPGALSARILQRFDLEAEILGRLQHPNIAQIYEAGIDTESGSPYLAMEYIAGHDLAQYADKQRLGPRARLELFVKLCDAIIHAHAKGIIHRDIKPGNVIVSGEGEPKVLDFGIARATDSSNEQQTMQTHVGQLVGTLYYMSPEQAAGDTASLDTRSDVYALGVVLFELLTGKMPYELRDKALHEAVRTIVETRPRRLSEIDQGFKGDLDIITLKSLEKDRERRYQSVAELRADIQRSLENKPIQARPPSTLYLATKFVRRNTRLTIATLVVLLIFGLGGSFALKQWYGGIQARQVALDNMLLSLSEMDVQKGLVPDLSKRLLDLYADNGELLFSGDPESLAVFYTNLGEAYFGYEDYRRALTQFEKAYKIRSKSLRAPDPLLAQALHHIANAEFYLNEYDLARDHYLQTLEMYEALYASNDPETAETARTLDHLGSTYVKLGESDKAVAMYTKARDLRVALFGPGSLEVAMSDNSIAWFHVQQGQPEVAEPIYRRALNILEGLDGDESKPLWVARAKHSLGNTLISLGQYDEARLLLTSSLELKTELLSGNKPSVASTLQSLAEVCRLSDDYDNAERYALQVVQIRQEIGDPRLSASEEILEQIRFEKSN
ncbi:MAG: tetratricopeptide repeat protein [Phycisphaerales bacterium JB052]